MSVGSATVRVLLVALNLSIIGIVAVSAVGLTEGFELDFNEESIIFEISEEKIDVRIPLGIRFGGYWDIEDFHYRLFATDGDGVLLSEDGKEGITLKRGVMNNLVIRAKLNFEEMFGSLGQDLFFDGASLHIGVELGASYLSSIIEFDIDLDIALELDPMFTNFGISSPSYDDVEGTLNVMAIHEASDMFQGMEFPVGVQLANDTQLLGSMQANVDLSQPSTLFEIAVNAATLADALASGDMLFLMVGLSEDGLTLSPSFRMDLFQLNGIDVDVSPLNLNEIEVDIELDTFSEMPGSLTLDGRLTGTGPTTNADAPVSLALNTVDTGSLKFTGLDPSEYLGKDYTVELDFEAFGVTWTITHEGSMA